MDDTKPKRAWVLRISPLENTNRCLDENIVGVGWSLAKALSTIYDWDDFKQEIRQTHDYDSNRALGNAAGSVWRFMREMDAGDLAIIPHPEGFLVAEIESRVFWSEDDSVNDFSWQRRVKWLTQAPIPRNRAANSLRRRMKARQTCVDASDLLDEIVEALGRNTSLSLIGEIRDSTVNTVIEKIDRTLDNKGLEHLVCALVRASGASAEVQPTRQEAEGDVDVLALLKIPAPVEMTGGKPEIRVGYQVKHHDGQTGLEGLDQIRVAVENGKVDYGFLVTSAPEFSLGVTELITRSLEREAGENMKSGTHSDTEIYSKIGLINRRQLAEWLLDVGLEKLDLEGLTE